MGTAESSPEELEVIEPEKIIEPLDPVLKMVGETGTGIALLSSAECIVFFGALIA